MNTYTVTEEDVIVGILIDVKNLMKKERLIKFYGMAILVDIFYLIP
jgi:hypothetical protein